MIQELLGAAGFISGEGKPYISGSIFEATTSPLPLSNTTTTATITTTTTTTTTTSTNNSNNTSSNSENNQNLRCPRCDSSNTKFCYYNNYNLTQPRHFCKTCRRYWTKGGALRNVPIGGGCRKNKNSSSTHVSAGSFGKSSSSSSANKMKTMAYPSLGNGFDHHHRHEFSSSPIMWNSPQNSQLLAILRTSSQDPNTNPAAGSLLSSSTGSHVIKGEPVLGETAAVLNSGTMVLNPLSQQQIPYTGLCSSLWKNTQHQAQQYQQNGFLIGHEVQNSGFQELYQRLKSSTNNYYADHSTSPGVLLSKAASASSSSSAATIFESAPVAGGELGYWNPVLSWSDLPTTNGS